MEKGKKRIYTIQTSDYNDMRNMRIKTFEDENDWKKEIDKEAVSFSYIDEFKIAIYEVKEDNNNSIDYNHELWLLNGRMRDVYEIPESWGKPVFVDNIFYYSIIQNEQGRWQSNIEDDAQFETREEAERCEAPAQYLNYRIRESEKKGSN